MLRGGGAHSRKVNGAGRPVCCIPVKREDGKKSRVMQRYFFEATSGNPHRSCKRKWVLNAEAEKYYRGQSELLACLSPLPLWALPLKTQGSCLNPSVHVSGPRCLECLVLRIWSVMTRSPSLVYMFVPSATCSCCCRLACRHCR
jgi:hypothetical protein